MSNTRTITIEIKVEDCSQCNGTGKITTSDQRFGEYKTVCPTCNGNGFVPLPQYNK